MSNQINSPSGRPRSIHADQAILQATLDLLADVGYQSMSIEAIASRAGVGKTTIYRRYTSKEELVADAIESLRDDLAIPDTGSFWGDMDILIENAAKKIDSPLGRQTLALIISTASSNPQFAEVYWTKYTKLRREAFSKVLERAQSRGEIHKDADVDLIIDLVSGSLYYALIFKPTTEPVEAYMRRTVNLLMKGVGSGAGGRGQGSRGSRGG
ncbi:MAG: TetR/AcrR family transcriptional regulator [Nostoc sp. NMS1]|uniref:TetR/AcrR family transcriptional regulator n=1 Tax=unclassified Nostoc TaxID=2593658 RepID=UPI0025CE5C8D|nr:MULTISPECIES: TetR/AcrR family transcriptional regulator [unclassified Nostoc]MBN3910375.1 TetR/AcrR family transcriptional regulator [Nostoc sp. NMS1]MBN3994795.1 TetR/AcrR family transcriptional regulator [Nostoc sp. NMS2]